MPPLRTEDLAVLDAVCALLSAAVNTLQGRAIADFSANTPGQLRSPYEILGERGKLSVTVRKLHSAVPAR